MAKKASSRQSSPAMEAAEISSAISEAGFDWVAEQVFSLQELPGLGLQMPEEEMESFATAIEASNQLESFAMAFAAPTALDWRNNDGDWVTSIKNQFQCGACVSFACCATIEARLNIVCQDQNRNTDLSEAHLFFGGCSNCCNHGWQFEKALEVCRTTGVGLDKDFPYTPNNQPPRNITSHVRINSWRAILSMNERKSILASKGPVVAGMRVWSDFFNYRSGIYRRLPSATFAGLHAVCVVGYDDTQQCWIVKNSWGTNWGENGFCRIAYGQVDIDTTFPFYDIKVDCPEAGPDGGDVEEVCQEYVPALKKVLAAAREEPNLRSCLRYYIARRGGTRPFCNERESKIVHYVHKVLQHCPARYRESFIYHLG